MGKLTARRSSPTAVHAVVALPAELDSWNEKELCDLTLFMGYYAFVVTSIHSVHREFKKLPNAYKSYT
jgi:hypothetical protein